MWPEHIPYVLETGAGPEFPRMFRVEQLFPRKRLDDVPGAATASMEALALPDLSGKRIAVAAGSRGIADIVPALRSVVAFLKKRGAEPFIVPAMGSHGGATAAGQLAMLSALGMTEESLGAEIRATMGQGVLPARALAGARRRELEESAHAGASENDDWMTLSSVTSCRWRSATIRPLRNT